jgi:hypothetical protein
MPYFQRHTLNFFAGSQRDEDVVPGDRLEKSPHDCSEETALTTPESFPFDDIPTSPQDDSRQHGVFSVEADSLLSGDKYYVT